MTSPPVTTLVWDIDDTLYDVGTGFTAHRNGDAVFDFMVEALGFETRGQRPRRCETVLAKTLQLGRSSPQPPRWSLVALPSSGAGSPVRSPAGSWLPGKESWPEFG